MTTTFKQARKIAREYRAKTWQPHEGTLYVAKEGYEDELGWLVVVGARELLVDDDERFMPNDDRVIVVDKATGEVTELNMIFDTQRLEAMRPTK